MDAVTRRAPATPIHWARPPNAGAPHNALPLKQMA
jgi:hypothetical protein